MATLTVLLIPYNFNWLTFFFSIALLLVWSLSSTHPAASPVVYQIRVQGHLGQQWSDWFDGLTITHEENGQTFLTGPVVDQSALYGLLKKVRDLGLPLVAVLPLKPLCVENEITPSK